jgi:Protein of unknown function (DUF2800)
MPNGVKRHARLGPSSSDIWLTCLGAPAMWSTRPPKRVGFAAHEGTLAHALCEAALELNAVPWKAGLAFEVDGDLIEITNEMLNAVQLFATTTGSLSDVSDWRVSEHEVSLAWLWATHGEEPPELVFGTCDFAACDGLTLYVLDFKFGRGKGVRVDHNTQLLLYALGLYDKLVRERPDLAATIETVCLMIVQPRAGGNPVRSWAISLGDLLYWGFSTFKPSVEIIANGGGPLVAGNHCYFCAASIDCPVYTKYRTQRSIDSFPDYDPELDTELELI